MPARRPRPLNPTRRHVPPEIPPGFRRATPVSAYFARLGKTYMRTGPDNMPVFGLQVRPNHGNRHGTGHGGFLATLLDTFMAAMVHAAIPGVRLWTTDLKVKYLRPAQVGVWMEGHCVSVTREGDRATVICDLKAGDVTICRGTARFKLVPLG